jgi:hypothetical protein
MPTSETIAQQPALLRISGVYNPYLDESHAELIVVIGNNDVHRLPLSLSEHGQLDAFPGLFIIARRREKNVVIYSREVVTLGSSEVMQVHLLERPYRWVKAGSKWGVLFPATKEIPRTPVKALPTDPANRPVKNGPKEMVSPRKIASHLGEIRKAAMKKFRPQARKDRWRREFPQRLRPTTELINWAGYNIKRWEGYSTPWTFLGDYPTVRWYRTFSSVNTPGYRSAKKSRLPVNPYSLTRIKTEDPIGMDYRISASAPTYILACEQRPSSTFFSVPTAPAHDGLAYSLALSRSIKRAEIGINGNLAQDIAQVGQMTRMVGDSIHRIVASIHNVKRGHLKAAAESLMTPTTASRGLGYRVSGEFGRKKKSSRSVLPVDLRTDMTISRVDLDLGRVVSPAKSVAENWLALQYGWKPLLSDIHGAIKSVADFMSDPGEDAIRAVKASAKKVDKQKVEQGVMSHHYQKTGMMEITSYSYCKIGYRYRVASALKTFLSQTGFTNPINLAWEVLPYSFVADWFLPIGPYLDTFSAFYGL